MPKIAFLIPSPLLGYSEARGTVELEADDVADALRKLTTRFPELLPHLLNFDGNLLPHVQLYVNDNHIRDLDGELTRLTDQDQILLLLALAGG